MRQESHQPISALHRQAVTESKLVREPGEDRPITRAVRHHWHPVGQSWMLVAHGLLYEWRAYAAQDQWKE